MIIYSVLFSIFGQKILFIVTNYKANPRINDTAETATLEANPRTVYINSTKHVLM